MAGIGFDLEEIFRKNTYGGDAVAYTAAAVTISGAWIFGLLALIVVFLKSSSTLSSVELSLLFTMITYSYAGAMLITSVLTFPITRYLADCLHQGKVDSFGPAFSASCVLHLTLALLLGSAFYAANPLPTNLQVSGVLLLVSCTQLWLCTTFVGLMRFRLPAAVTFLMGYSFCALGATQLGARLGLLGYLAGFGLGLSLMAMALTCLLASVFSFPRVVDFGFIRLLWQRPFLAPCGLALALGSWIDKILFWASPWALPSAPYLRSYTPYDMSFFLGYTLSIPVLTWLILRVETGFARRVQELFAHLTNRQPYERIQAAKIAIADNMNQTFRIFLTQMVPIGLLAIFGTPTLLRWLHLPDYLTHLVRISILSCVGASFLQVHVLYLMYFDLSGMAFVACGVFLVANYVGTALTLQWGFRWFGLGFLVSSYLGTIVSMVLINRSMPRIEFIVMQYYARIRPRIRLPSILRRLLPGHRAQEARP